MRRFFAAAMSIRPVKWIVEIGKCYTCALGSEKIRNSSSQTLWRMSVLLLLVFTYSGELNFELWPLPLWAWRWVSKRKSPDF